ncbi:hypothetical protein JCM11641_000303 [Rhodosporidiobolus odoratus]
MASSQRTLAVLFAPENHHYIQRLRRLLLDNGFTVLKEEDLDGEQLEEAGIDLGLGVGEDRLPEDAKEDAVYHTVLVVERPEAVARVKELKTSTIAECFPSLRLFVAPSASAANMAIDSIFPSLPSSPAPASPSILAFPSSGSSTDSKPKPFALSNLAFVETQPAPAHASTRMLSPSIERALEELEEREERRRTGSTSTRASKNSFSDSRLASRASGIASTRAEDGFTADASEMQERRVFTAHSRESSEDFAEACEQDEGFEDEEPGITAGLPEQGLEAEDTQDDSGAEAAGDSAGAYVDEEQDDAVPGVESPSLLSAPTLSRMASTLSSTSATSSNPSSSSFRARPAPTGEPTVQPRLTKAAALRLGISVPPTTPRRTSSETPSSADAASVPRVVPTPKSLAASSIAPRMTKSASLRTGQGQEASSSSQTPRPAKRQSISTAERAAMDRAARRHSIQVPSLTAQPAIEVRLSRAAMLRQGLELPPTTPRLSRQSSATSAEEPKTTMSAASRRVSVDLKALREPTLAPRSTRSSALRTGSSGSVGAPAMTRGRSLGTLEELLGAEQQQGLPQRVRQPVNYEGVPGHKRRESIQVKATAPPKMEVRMSRAARLRNGIPEEITELKRAKTEPVSFEGVPGHRRRETIAVASSRPPSITPRLNRAVLLRHTSDGPSLPSLVVRPASSLGLPSTTSTPLRVPSRNFSSTPQPSMPKPPTIAPRLNRAAELRAANKAGEEQKKDLLQTQTLGKKSNFVQPSSAKGKGGLSSRPATALGLGAALRETTNSPGPK